LLIAALTSTCYAAVDERDSLRDLDGVKVVVEDVSKLAEARGVQRDQLQRGIEAKLRAAGIKVLNSGEFPVGDPYLRVRVDATEEKAGMMAYHLSLEFAQVVFMRRDPTITFNRAATWKAPDRIGLVPAPKLSESIQNDLSGQLDQFIEAFRAVNPR